MLHDEEKFNNIIIADINKVVISTVSLRIVVSPRTKTLIIYHIYELTSPRTP